MAHLIGGYGDSTHSGTWPESALSIENVDIDILGGETYHRPDLIFRSRSTMTHFPLVLSSSGVDGGAQYPGVTHGGK